MRKKYILFAGILLCALALSACGANREEESEAAAGDTEAQNDGAAEEPVNADTTAAEDSGAEDETEEPAEEEESVRPSDTVFTDATIEETVLYDADGVTVTATGFDAGAEYGPEIATRVENESGFTIDVTVEDVTVNGYQLGTGLFYVVAAPGETLDSAITLYDYMLDDCGIDTVAEISLSIVVSDDATYEEIGTGDRVTLETSAAEDYAQAVDDSGEVLYEEDGIRVISQGLSDEGIWDGALLLYAENDTGRYVGVTCRDVTINGRKEEDVSFWIDLLPDTRGVSGLDLMSLPDQTFDSIGEVEEISFRLLLIDQDTGETFEETDPITLTFK